jgi:hypothetical protein
VTRDDDDDGTKNVEFLAIQEMKDMFRMSS